MFVTTDSEMRLIFVDNSCQTIYSFVYVLLLSQQAQKWDFYITSVFAEILSEHSCFFSPFYKLTNYNYLKLLHIKLNSILYGVL